MHFGLNSFVAGTMTEFFMIFFCLFSLAEEILRDEVEEYVKNHRGKELPGFVNYRTFENIVKKHIQELEEPALKLLKDITGESLMMAESMVYLFTVPSINIFSPYNCNVQYIHIICYYCTRKIKAFLQKEDV